MGKAKHQSAYALFVSENRPVVKEREPTLGFGALSKKLGQIWKGMSDAEKAPYHEKAHAGKRGRKTSK
jgi:hypothetical protein